MNLEYKWLMREAKTKLMESEKSIPKKYLNKLETIIGKLEHLQNIIKD